MRSRFRLQITDEDGHVIRVPAGGTLEADLRKVLADALVKGAILDVVGTAAAQQKLIDLAKGAIVAQGVGLFRSEAQVTSAIDVGLREALRTVTQDLTLSALPFVDQAIHDAFQALKDQTIQAV